jgi:hypothetical protein
VAKGTHACSATDLGGKTGRGGGAGFVTGTDLTVVETRVVVAGAVVVVAGAVVVVAAVVVVDGEVVVVGSLRKPEAS